MSFIGDTWTKAKDGCLDMATAAQTPMVRSKKTFAAALDKPPPASVFAKGNAHKLELSLDPNGGMLVASDLATGQITYESLREGEHVFGVSTTTSEYPKVLLTFATGKSESIVATLAAKKTLDVVVSTMSAVDSKMSKVGTVKLTYVPEK